MEAAISRSTSPVPSLLPSSKTNRVTACAATIVADNSWITDRTVAASLWTGITTASCGRTEFSGAVCSSIVSRSFQEDSLVRGRRTVVGREVPVDRRLEAVSEEDLRPAVLQVRAERLAELSRVAVLFPQEIVRSFLGLERRRIDARGTRKDDLRDVGPPGGLVHMVVDCEV